MKESWLGFTIHVHHKGGNSQQEMNRANQVSQQQLQQQQQQLALQQQQFGMVNPILQQMLGNPALQQGQQQQAQTLSQIIGAGGMLPAQEAAMRSAAMAQTGAGERQAIGSINDALLARGITGGGMAGGGQVAQNYGALEQGLLGQQAQNLQNIQLAKGQNLNTALNLGLGQTGQLYNTLGTTLGIGQQYGQQGVNLGQQGIGALGIGQQAAYGADQSQTGFWGSLVGGLAGMGSAGIGKIPCWVAAELYGAWDAPEAYAIREWLVRTWYMRPFLLIYLRFGKEWAEYLREHRRVRSITKRVFDFFLKQAYASR